MKSGIDYFPLDVSLDDKIELIEAEFGLTGFAVIVKLFQKIYGGQGYYCEWTNEVALLFAKRIGLGGSVVSEIVSASVKRGIFSDRIFKEYGILTSAGIQKRYLEAVSRRKKIPMKKEYLLLKCAQLPENVDISSENVYKNQKNDDISKQSKEKKSKVEESKVIRPLAQAVEDFREYRRKMKKPMTDRAVELLYQKLDELAGNNEKDKIAILQQSIVNGWQGVFPLKDQRSGTISKAPEGNVFLKMLKEYEDDD